MVDYIMYYNIDIIYFKGDWCKYKDRLFIAKDPIGEINKAQLPPEYPETENKFWKTK